MTLYDVLRKLTNRRCIKSGHARHAPRLAVELLEDRLTPSSATQLAFTTSPVLVIAGQPSTMLTVQLEDANDTVTQAGPGGVSVNLSTDSGGNGALFLDTNGDGLSSPTLFIAQGTSSASFKYEDNRLGSPTLTAAAASLSSVTQQEAIDANLGVYGLNDDMTPGTLRYAIAHATAGQTIAFAPGVFGTIQLTSPLPALATSVNIIGPDFVDIDGSSVFPTNSGVLAVSSGATVTIADINVRGTNNTGISNDGTLTLNRVVISNTNASALAPFGAAGGIYNDGTLTVHDCQIVRNGSFANLGAAGIDNEPKAGGGIATITDSIISGNSGTGIVNNGTMTLIRDFIEGNAGATQASFNGFTGGAPGGIYNGGTLTILSSTIDGNSTNQASVAAGIDSQGGAVTISDSTISDNQNTQSAGVTGGIGIFGGTLVISNSTVTRNSTSATNASGGGIDAGGTSVTIFDTIVAGNSGTAANPTDVSGSFTSSGHNWIGIADSHSSGFVASDIVGTIASPKDPKLASSLTDNGGSTLTLALLPGSPCIDAGDNANAPATDQRGLPRIVNGTIDIGAYEFQIVLIPSILQPAQVGVSYDQTISGAYGTAPYTFAVTAGALPAGLSLAANGGVAGTPTAGGAFTFTVTATDSSPGTAYSGSQQYTLVVVPPTLTFTPAPPGAPLNTAYSQQLTASGGTAPYSNYTISGGQLPPGLTLSTGGLISGTPTAAGVYFFNVSVTDSSTGTGPFTESRQLAIVVTPPGFSYDGNTLTLFIEGTAAHNEFDYAQATTQDAAGDLHTTFAFTLNGVELDVPDSLLFSVRVSAQGDSNTAVLVTNDTYLGIDGQRHETAETAVLGGSNGSLLVRAGVPNQIQLDGFLTIYAYMGRADSGALSGILQQGGENIFVSAGAYSYVTGLGQYYEVSGAPIVYGYAVNPADQAWHYDTAAMDSFVASGNAYSYMSGTDNGQSFFNEAVGFQVTYAIATHGQSYAYLIDSPGNDVFVGYAPYSYMSGSDDAGALFNVAEGFLLVYGESFVGGTDFAYNYDPQHNILGGNWMLLT